MSLVKHKINNKRENINIMGYNPKNNKIRNSMANLVNNKFIFLNKINMQQQLKNEKKRSSVNKLLYEIKLNYYTESNNNNISQNQNQINNVITLKKSSNNCDINNSNTLLNSIDLSFLSKTLDKSKNKKQQKRLYSVSNSINESINYSPESRLHKNSKISGTSNNEVNNNLKKRQQINNNRTQLLSDIRKKKVNSIEKNRSQLKYRSKSKDSQKNKKMAMLYRPASFINNIKKVHTKAKKFKFFYKYLKTKNSLVYSERDINKDIFKSQFSKGKIYNNKIMTRLNKMNTHSHSVSVSNKKNYKLNRSLNTCSTVNAKKSEQIKEDKNFNKRKTIASGQIKDNNFFINMNNYSFGIKRKSDCNAYYKTKSNLNRNSTDYNNIISEKIEKMKKSCQNSKRCLDFNKLIINNNKYVSKKTFFNDIQSPIEYHHEKNITTDDNTDINTIYEEDSTKESKQKNQTILDDNKFNRIKTSQNYLNCANIKNKNNVSNDSIKKNRQNNNNHRSSNYDFHINLKTKNINIKHNRHQSLVLDSIFIKNNSKKKRGNTVNKKSSCIKTEFNSKKKIKDNIINNSLFEDNNMNELTDDIDDKFDDIYSVVNKIKFNNVLSINEDLFTCENKKYIVYKQNYDIKYENYFYTKNKKKFN